MMPGEGEVHLWLSAVYAEVGEYDHAWSHAKKCRELGGTIPADWLEDPKKVSGPTE